MNFFVPYFRKTRALYESFFSVQEIGNSKVLQLFGWVLLLGYFVTLKRWSHRFYTTKETALSGDHVCWPFWPDCGEWYMLQALPYGYSEGIFYAFLLGIMLLAGIFLFQKKWVWAHMCLVGLFIWKLYHLGLSMDFINNYEYHHLMFCLGFLVIPHKLFFLRFYLVFFYFLSTASKLEPSWLLGSYFTSLKTGLPIFPDSLTPFFTNLVIGIEMMGVWFLLSDKKWRFMALGVMIGFHLYSIIFVKYHYPSIVFPALLVLFTINYKKIATPLDLKSLWGWGLALLFLVSQLISNFIPGDERLTMEGSFYGLYMFESNHQCRITLKVGEADEVVRSRANARRRCNPYKEWFKAKQKYCTSDQDVSLKIDHSVDGGPFYRVVEESDICDLEYKIFSHNEWIKFPPEAKVVGRPVQNYYR